ncbi:MAG: hypothetical protein J7J52_04755 [Deltaproteobacteria bacterium]|nr:hypothetical protein [Deltaproteobacteria bacterium]
MLSASGYRTKKELKAAIGQRLKYYETSLFGSEYRPNGTVLMVGPDAYHNRKWYAKVTLRDDVIVKVE